MYLSLAVIIMNPLMAVLLLRADHLYSDVILCPIWTVEWLAMALFYCIKMAKWQRSWVKVITKLISWQHGDFERNVNLPSTVCMILVCLYCVWLSLTFSLRSLLLQRTIKNILWKTAMQILAQSSDRCQK